MAAPSLQGLLGLDELEDVRVERARRHLLPFIRYTFPTYQAGWFAQDVCRRLERFLKAVRAQQSPRLMLFSPPRAGKSELVSRRFPSWALGKDPDLSIITTSYSDDLAGDFSRDVQRILTTDEYRRVFPETTLSTPKTRSETGQPWIRQADQFEIVGRRGVYRARGVGGGLTGRGAACLLIDDPVKDDAEAHSPTRREMIDRWYQSTAYTRLAPGGGVLLVMTRWHEDDLAGRLLQRMADDPKADQWEVVRYPAIAEQDEYDEEGRLLRREGEALQPERYSLDMLQKFQASRRVWTALYQQRPTSEEGQLFNRKWWKFWRYPTEPEIPSLASRTVVVPERFEEQAISWDCTFKKGDGTDLVCGGAWGRLGANKYLLDVEWRRMDFVETLKAFSALAERNPKARAKYVEDTANGPAVIATFRNEIAGIIPIQPEGGKEARAAATSPEVEAGNVYLRLHAPWRDAFIEEHAQFPNGAHDDAVDMQSQLLNRWAKGRSNIEFLRKIASRA